MKKSIIIGSIVIVCGFLIALGPQFLFKVCAAHGGAFPLCHWTARAEIGMGMLIAALGICLIVFTDPKTQIGLTIAILLASIMVIGIPHALIGGCSAKTMACRKVAFPVITVIGIVLLVYSIIVVVYSEKKKPLTSESGNN
jgi:hypothetical protein